MPDNKNPSGKGQQEGSSTAAVDWEKEDAYWREKHGSQPYADKESRYEDYAAAYHIAVQGAAKHGGRSYEEVEEELESEYQQAERAVLPWDKVQPAVRAAWDRVSGVIGPRDFDRGIRGSL